MEKWSGQKKPGAIKNLTNASDLQNHSFYSNEQQGIVLVSVFPLKRMSKELELEIFLPKSDCLCLLHSLGFLPRKKYRCWKIVNSSIGSLSMKIQHCVYNPFSVVSSLKVIHQQTWLLSLINRNFVICIPHLVHYFKTVTQGHRKSC